MRIGVLTYFQSHNYGSFLQGYALVHWLRSLGYDAELINFNMEKASERFGKPVMGKDPFRYYYSLKKYKMFMENIKKAPTSGSLLITDDSEKLREKIYGKYDFLVVGSDEVWRTDNFRGFPNPYFLLGDFGCTKCAFSVSSLSDDDGLSSVDKGLFEEAIKSFSYISTRDLYSKRKLEKSASCPVFLTCDPTFLYDFKIDRVRGRELLENRFGINRNKKVVGFMNNDRKFARELKKVLGTDVELIAIYDYVLGLKNTLAADPFQWIDIISAMDFMVTSYFHGTCFSILGNTPFFAVDYGSPDKGHSKIYDLLSRIDLESRYAMKSDVGYLDKTISSCRRAFQEKTRVDFSDKVKSLKKETGHFLEFISDR